MIRLLKSHKNGIGQIVAVLFFSMGVLGTMIGGSVRSYMVHYFFPSGTVCAVIQTSVARILKPGERNRPVWLLKVWGAFAAVLTIPTKISLSPTGKALLGDISLLESRAIGIATDPLYYGIGIVVGPRVGLGMLMGSFAVPFLITDTLAGTHLDQETGDWIKWLAIALLTLPTFATILFSYFFKSETVVPSGFNPGQKKYRSPANKTFIFGLLGAVMVLGVALSAQALFSLPWHITLITVLIAWPLCVVNGRVTGDTDINPVRLVAVVLLSGLFWLFADHGSAVIAMLGMAVVGGTLAAVAVDMMQDFRAGYLVDANPTHQTTVQIVGSFFGAIVSVPVLNMLITQLGLGADSALPAPGAQIWATMAKAMAGGFQPSPELLWAIVITSLVGSLYAYLTVWPKTAKWMPSLFGIGIGLLIGINGSFAIFLGGLLKWFATLYYRSGNSGAEIPAANEKASNETMLVGASIFAAGALLSIFLVLLKTLCDSFGLDLFTIAH